MLACTVAIQPANAQLVYGSVVGVVEDQSGAVVPGAAVTLVNRETALTREASADAEGRYSFVNVLPGRYNLKVTAKGFRTTNESDFEVSPTQVARLTVKLEVGQLSDQVTVEATAALLQTDKADTHTEIGAKEIQNLPLGGYRNYQSLINLVPGALPAAFQNSITDTPGRALATHINGGNAQTNMTRIDGAESVNVWLPHHVGYVAPEETIETVNITTGSADAEQGLAGSSAITLVTRSGTNQIHGSAYEFHDDQHLKARNFFQGYGTQKPISIYNNYGATLGGAIIKNKVFYFGSFDGTKQKTGSPSFYTVPTADQRLGDFSAYSTKIYDPATGNSDGTGRTQFPGNIIPANRISSIAQKLQSFYPAPNIGGAFTNNYTVAGGPTLDRDYYDLKLNWNRNERHVIWGKYGRMQANAGGGGVFGIAGGPGLGGADPGLGHTVTQIATIGHTYTLSPNLLLDGVVGYQRQVQTVKGNDYGTNYGTQFGIPGVNGPDIRQSGFPDIVISNYTGMGVPNWMPLFRNDESYTNSDNLTWTKGAHEIRFGFDLVRHHLNHWQPEIAGGPRGDLEFYGGVTALSGGPSPNQYNAYAQFLLGQSSYTSKSLQYILSTGREWQFGWYAADRWQVSQKLTVNIGLRYELYPLMTRAGYGIERYDPSSNLVYLGGRGNVPTNAGISVSHKLFAPRIGIAYRLDDKTVIRSGYGINYDPIPFSRPLRGWYPLVINSNQVAPNGFAPISTLSQGLPPIVGPDISSGIVPLQNGSDERSPGNFIHRGYVQSWNFTIERKLPQNILLSAGYVGTHSVHLLADRNLNNSEPGTGTAGLPYFQQYGRTAQTLYWDGYLSSNYHSLQVSLNRSFANGLLLKGAYTWAKAIDYTDDDGWASVGFNSASQFQRNRAVAGFDRTQVFQMAWVYELPFGKGKKMLNSGPAAYVAGNWQLNGIFSAYTGIPFTVTGGAAIFNSIANTQTANQLVGSVTKTGNFGPGQFYYDPKAFAPVTSAVYGNSGRNILRNPGTANADLSLFKVIQIKEKIQVQFRAEAFNVTNSAHFGNGSGSAVNGSASSGSFMQITSATGERQFRFGLRLQW